LIESFGIGEILRELTSFPSGSKKVFGEAVKRSSEVLRDFTKKLPPVSAARTGYAAKGIPVAPKHGGTLRQSIQNRKLALLAAGVFPGANYGVHVHEGTSKMPARPFLDWALELGAEEMIDKIFEEAVSKFP
jgi:HK97 gp10 family phage protein